MRLPGWCRKCKRFRYVRVDSPGMVMAATHGVAEGVCSDCENEPRGSAGRPGGGRPAVREVRTD